MHSARSVWLFCSFLIAISTWGQATSSQSQGATIDPSWVTHPIRDPQAVQTVQASVTAMGGAELISQIQSYIVQGQVQRVSVTNNPSGTIVWTVAGTESRSDYPSAQGTATLASGHGNGFQNANGTITKVPPHIFRSLFVPALVASVLLRELQDSNYSVQNGGTSTIGSEPVTIIKTSSQATRMESMVTPQTWYFDSGTKLPVRVEYREPDPKILSRGVHASYDLSGYEPIQGVLYPLKAIKSIDQHQNAVLQVSSIQPNATVAPSVFDSPAGGVQ